MGGLLIKTRHIEVKIRKTSFPLCHRQGGSKPDFHWDPGNFVCLHGNFRSQQIVLSSQTWPLPTVTVLMFVLPHWNSVFYYTCTVSYLYLICLILLMFNCLSDLPSTCLDGPNLYPFLCNLFKNMKQHFWCTKIWSPWYSCIAREEKENDQSHQVHLIYPSLFRCFSVILT